MSNFYPMKSCCLLSKTTNCTHPTGSCNFLLVLIYSKLHSKSFDYLYKSCVVLELLPPKGKKILSKKESKSVPFKGSFQLPTSTPYFLYGVPPRPWRSL